MEKKSRGIEAQQLEMFGDIGMAKSPAKKDPISGNEIPKASTAEEVRDDIPAKLSEGEFVLPADVVRYHGLEKLMNLRQQAKQGINTMDKMGQLGNAEEATMPDDLPFNVNDIEMSEGGMVNVAGQPMQLPRIAGQQIEMQTGGFVNPTGTFQTPTNIATTPSYFQNYAQTTAPFKPFIRQNQTAIPPVVPVTPPRTTGPSFQTLVPSEGQRPVTKEYRNAAGQKLFIPFINNKPIYPIPEGYTEYVEEKTPIAEDKPVVKTPTTTVTGEGSDDIGVGVGTSLVGKTGKGVSQQVNTDFANQTPEQVTDNFGKMSAGEKGLAVANAMQQAKGYTGFAKGFQQMGAAITPGVLGAMMYGEKTMNPADVLGKIGTPNSAALNAITAAFGPNTTGLSPGALGGINTNEAISQALYGMSLADAARSMGGVTPSLTVGYKNGDIDPTTGNTYSFGQAGDPFGVPSYTSIAEFGKAMAASSKTGFMGSYATAKAIATDPNKSPKQKAKAIAFGREINPFFDMDIDERSDQEVQDDLDTISQEAGKTAQGKAELGFNDMTAFGDPPSTTNTTSPNTDSGQSADGGDGPGGTSSGAGGAEGSVGDGYGGGDYKGAFVGTQYKTNKGLAGKKKPKTKKMKRGGLASR